MTFWADLKHGVRLLVKDWSFTLAAVATLSIGIAVNMLVFTLINGALLRDLPFGDPDRIVEIRVFHRDRPQVLHRGIFCQSTVATVAKIPGQQGSDHPVQ